jgi:hypothetical protein
MIFSSRNKILIGMILIAAISRLLPHPYNFTPIGAMALFAGTYILNKRLAILMPVAILFVSDLIIQIAGGTGFYKDMIFVYGSFVLITMLGFLLRGREQGQSILVASLISSVVFFLITNFGVWLFYNTYPRSIEGLMSCYTAGIPFFRGTVMGDLFYNLVLFGSFAILKWRKPVLVKA